MAAAQMAAAQATAEVLKTFIPQLFSSPKLMSEGAPDVGSQDAWMLSNFPADVLLPLAGLEFIAQVDKRDEIHDFVMLCLSGFKGIGGFTSKQGENIAVGLAGSSGKRLVKRPGLIGRNVTNRGWERKAKDAQVIE